MKPSEELTYRSQDVERAILCKFITDGYIDTWAHEGLFVGDERTLFNQLKDLWNQTGEIDSFAIKDELKPLARHILSESGTMSRSAISTLVGAYLRREAARGVLSIYGSDEKPEDVPKLIQAHMSNLLTNHEQAAYNHPESIARVFEIIKEGCIGTKMLGLPIGIDGFDSTTHGFERKKMYLIGALKKTGKSRFMVYVALKLAE